MIGEPRIDERPDRPTLGIRVQTPMKGMFAVADKLVKEMFRWMAQQGVEAAGPPFLRFHVIDMQGEMDIEVGIPVEASLTGDERVKAGVLPAGRYASLIFTGHGLTANKALLQWIAANGLVMDRWADARGDAFRARTETYLTDPRTEPRKKNWEVEVAIKLADETPRAPA